MSTLIALEAAAHIVTVIAGTLVVYQLYLFLKQQRRAAFEKTHDTTRQLILVGMDRPELLELLSGGHLGGSSMARRYMQLWVNHILEMYNANQNGLLDHSQWEAMELDITAFTKLPAMKESWSIIKGNYPTKFHVFMDGLMKESS